MIRKLLLLIALSALVALVVIDSPPAERIAEPSAPTTLVPAEVPAAVTPPGFFTTRVRGSVREPVARYATHSSPAEAAAIQIMDPDKPATSRVRGFGFASAEEVGGPVAGKAPRDDARVADSALATRFDSTDFDTNLITTGQLFIPSDTTLAVGPDFVMGVTNTTFAIHDQGGALLTRASLFNFFAGVGPTTFTFDPKVIWDQYAQRWVMITLELTDIEFGNAANTSRIFFAVSDDADPRGDWTIAELDSSLVFFNSNLQTTVDHFADFPGLAVDEEAIYISVNMFAFFSSGGGTRGGTRLWLLAKGIGTGGLYEGGAFSASILDPYAADGVATTTQPAHMFGDAPADVGTWLVSYGGLSGGGNEFVQVIRLDDPLGAPLFTHEFVRIGDIEDFATALPEAPQAGSALDIHTNNRRALNAVWRDDSLWMTFTMVEPTSLEAQAYWVRMNTFGLGRIDESADQGGVSGDDIAPGTHTFFPWIAVNDRNQMAIGFAASGPAIFPGAYYAVRTPSAPAGTIGPSKALRAGADFYERPDAVGVNRWGDYNGVAIDPEDQCFWAYNQYAIERGTPLGGHDGRWGTTFGKFCAFNCGDGAVEPGEECDDANSVNEDECRNNCRAPACRDGIVDPDLGEACDDGNEIDTDGCLNDCTVNACGPVDTDGDGVNDLCDLDDDDDGVDDGDDCAPLDAGAFVEPALVGALSVTISSSTILSWNNQGQGVVYDIASGSLGDLRGDAGPLTSVCLADDRASSIAVDSRPPPAPGEGVWYLVRADNGCTGSYGHTTTGDERLPDSCP